MFHWGWKCAPGLGIVEVPTAAALPAVEMNKRNFLATDRNAKFWTETHSCISMAADILILFTRDWRDVNCIIYLRLVHQQIWLKDNERSAGLNIYMVACYFQLVKESLIIQCIATTVSSLYIRIAVRKDLHNWMRCYYQRYALQMPINNNIMNTYMVLLFLNLLMYVILEITISVSSLLYFRGCIAFKSIRFATQLSSLHRVVPWQISRPPLLQRNWERRAISSIA